MKQTAKLFRETKLMDSSKPYTEEEIMIEFAKLHVEAALKEAINNVRIIDDPNSYCGNTGSEYPPDQILDTDAILNSYPLENIK
jgi:hypothetical protein